MSKHNDAPGMRGYRPRNESGELRKKRSDTLIRTIEEEYGIELPGRSDMELGNYLKLHKLKSLNDLVTGR